MHIHLCSASDLNLQKMNRIGLCLRSPSYTSSLSTLETRSPETICTLIFQVPFTIMFSVNAKPLGKRCGIQTDAVSICHPFPSSALLLVFSLVILGTFAAILAPSIHCHSRCFLHSSSSLSLIVNFILLASLGILAIGWRFEDNRSRCRFREPK